MNAYPTNKSISHLAEVTPDKNQIWHYWTVRLGLNLTISVLTDLQEEIYQKSLMDYHEEWKDWVAGELLDDEPPTQPIKKDVRVPLSVFRKHVLVLPIVTAEKQITAKSH